MIIGLRRWIERVLERRGLALIVVAILIVLLAFVALHLLADSLVEAAAAICAAAVVFASAVFIWNREAVVDRRREAEGRGPPSLSGFKLDIVSITAPPSILRR